MANQTLSTFGPKISHFGSVLTRRNRCSSKAFDVVARRYVQGGPGSHSQQDITNAAKRGLNEALRTGENLKNKATSTTEDMAAETKETAQSVAEKAKQVAQGAWESAKETAQKTKETVLGKADEAKQTVKDTANRTKSH